MSIAVVPFDAAHLDSAASMLSGRCRADRLRQPGLPASLEDPAAARTVLSAMLEDPATDGFSALREERMVGYLIGERLLTIDSALRSLFFEPRAVLVPFAGYATDPGFSDEALNALYAVAAHQWVASGYFDHVVRATIDPVGTEPWFSFGFGRRVTSGLRRLDAGTHRHDPDVRSRSVAFRRGGPADRDAIHALVVDLVRFHGDSPVFLPNVPEAVEAGRALVASWLGDPAVACWLMEADGEAIGVVTIHPAEGFVDDGRRPDRCAYLYLGHVVEAWRQRGIGSALTEHGLQWARSAGYEACVVDWFTANAMSSAFWPRRGFVPFTGRLERRIDPRIAWASGNAQRFRHS